MKLNDIINLPFEVRFLFVAMMNAAIKMKELGKTEENYLSFAKEIWNSMNMNDIEHLKKIMISLALKEISDFEI